MATLRGSVQRVVTGRPVLIAGTASLGLIVLSTSLFDLFGPAMAAQYLITLAIPALVMVVYWRVARTRLLGREAEFGAAVELESVTNRAANAFLVGVAHELTPHPQKCSLRAEALAVAVDYRHVNPDLKVAVPDATIETDPHLLRQILHVLVGNAVRHGGSRVAIWAAEEANWVRLTVSDDGCGLPPELVDLALGRGVDLVEPSRTSRPDGTGLHVARTLCGLMGSQMTYKRDATWSHFSIRLPLKNSDGSLARTRVPLEVGVH